MSRSCKICGETNENSLLKFCRKCYYQEVKINDIRKPKNSNTKREFPKEMKSEVMKRDQWCIICGDSSTIEFHHTLYGWEAEYWEDRNNANKIVWLCQKHHHECHCDWLSNIRWFCKSYLWL